MLKQLVPVPVRCLKGVDPKVLGLGIVAAVLCVLLLFYVVSSSGVSKQQQAAKKALQKEVAEHEKVVAENTRLKADKIEAEKAAVEKAAVDKAAAASAPTNTLGMEFVKISKGDFQMGSPASEAGRDSDETQVAVSFSEDFELGGRSV